MYKPKTRSEKIARWTLLILMFIFTIYMFRLRLMNPHLTKLEFAEKVWSGNWSILIGIVITFVLLYVKSNWTSFKSFRDEKKDRV